MLILGWLDTGMLPLTICVALSRGCLDVIGLKNGKKHRQESRQGKLCSESKRAKAAKAAQSVDVF